MAPLKSENSDLDFLNQQASREDAFDEFKLDINDSSVSDMEHALPITELSDLTFIGKEGEIRDESAVLDLQMPDEVQESETEDEEVIRFVEVPDDDPESFDVEIMNDDSFSGISLDSDHLLAVDELEILPPAFDQSPTAETEDGSIDENELELLLPESELAEFNLDPEPLKSSTDFAGSDLPAERDLQLATPDLEIVSPDEESLGFENNLPGHDEPPALPTVEFELAGENDAANPLVSDDEPFPEITSGISEPVLSDRPASATGPKLAGSGPPASASNRPATGLEQFMQSNQHKVVQKRVKEQVARARQDGEKKAVRAKKSKAQKEGLSLSFASFLFENRRMLGLDIGTDSVKYVHLKSGSGGYRLLNCAVHPLPEVAAGASDADKQELISDKLAEILNAKVFKNTWVTTAISGLEILFKNIQIPRMGRKEMDKAVPWACRKDSPFPIEETTFEYSVIGGKEKKDKLDIFVVAAKKQLIENHVDLLKKASMRPDKLSTVPSAMLHLFRAYSRKPGEACNVIIDIGSHSSHIVFIMNGELQFVRQISTASCHFNESLFGNIFLDGQELSLSQERAEQVKKKYGIPMEPGDGQTEDGIPLKELATMMMPVAEKLSNEIQRTIDFYREKFKVEQQTSIYVTGGGALMPNLIAILSRALNSSVQLLNPLDILGRKKMTEEEQKLYHIGPRFSVAIGLALDQSKQLNMLPGNLKGSTTFEYIKRILRYLFFISVLAMALLSQKMNYQFDEVESEFKRLSAEYNATQPRRRLFLDLQNELQNLSKTREAYQNSLDIRLHAAEHLKAVSNLMPPDIALTALEITERTKTVPDDDKKTYQAEVVLLSGVAFENNSMEGINLAEFLMEIEKSGYFSAVFLRSQRMRPDGSIDFVVECETFD
jgi:type IV pilus assembly protein PilM